VTADRHAASAPPCPVCGGESTPDERFVPAPLRACTSCGFGFLDPETAGAEYDDEYFENYAGGDYLAHEAQRRHESQLRLDSIAPIVPAPARLLEVGAAAGFFLDEARRRGYTVRGIEPNAEMAAHARTLGLEVTASGLEDAQLEPGVFDLACAFHVLEHLPDPVQALAQIAAAVRPGGWIAVEVPNAASAAARRHGRAWQPLDLPYHLGHHSPGSLRTALIRAGLEVVQIDTVPFAHYATGPRALTALRGLAEAARGGDSPAVRPHPFSHQLLRGLARRPT
jgi:SAM-dependent methyltransferase